MATQNSIKYLNLSLGLIGEPPMTSINDTVKKAVAARNAYDIAVVEQFDKPVNWNFASARAQLNEYAESGTAVAPAFGYDHQFVLPPALRRFISFVDDNGDDIQYEYKREIYISGSKQIPVLLTNQTECRVRYLALLTNEGLWPGWFGKLVYLDVAIKICKPLTRDDRVAVDLQNKYDQAYEDAKAANGMENSKVDTSGKNFDQGNNDVLQARSVQPEYDPRYILREA